MSINSSGKKLEGFFSGKGFYIVLFLCAAVIGLSAWMMAAGNEAMKQQNQVNSMRLDNKAETVIIPPKVSENVSLPVIADSSEAPSSAAENSIPVWQEDMSAVNAPLWLWPVMGEVERVHDLENLSYDVTLKDWRCHNGIDICAPLGTEVAAVRSGYVNHVESDGLYGCLVRIEHGDGSESLYANLSEELNVAQGDFVEAGNIIGYVGDTAICEISQPSHLHFAMLFEGESVDPMDHLPA